MRAQKKPTVKYHLFLHEQHPIFEVLHPKMPKSTRVKLMTKVWSGLAPAARLQYTQRAAKQDSELDKTAGRLLPPRVGGGVEADAPATGRHGGKEASAGLRSYGNRLASCGGEETIGAAKHADKEGRAAATDL